jgi:hypothetical protein
MLVRRSPCPVAYPTLSDRATPTPLEKSNVRRSHPQIIHNIHCLLILERNGRLNSRNSAYNGGHLRCRHEDRSTCLLEESSRRTRSEELREQRQRLKCSTMGYAVPKDVYLAIRKMLLVLFCMTTQSYRATDATRRICSSHLVSSSAWHVHTLSNDAIVRQRPRPRSLHGRGWNSGRCE